MKRNEIITYLKNPKTDTALKKKAKQILLENIGDTVHYRGLLEFSNICHADCFYCGIRRSNLHPKRYQLEEEEVITTAQWVADSGFGSIVLQSGERTDKQFIDYVSSLVRKIKKKTQSSHLPKGLGITLSIGEQSPQNFKRLFQAGAHRYLLRIETSNPQLFQELHPTKQTITSRKASLITLKTIGYQVGTGVMIGLPGQTAKDLADDIQFFKKYDVDMIGMGPYIPHKHTPFAQAEVLPPNERLALSLRMIALTRIMLEDVNIAAATALQAIDPLGREKGLQAGANIIMPLVTPGSVRKHYQLYNNKPCIDEVADQCRDCLEKRLTIINRPVGMNEWGDSPHAQKNKVAPCL